MLAGILEIIGAPETIGHTVMSVALADLQSSIFNSLKSISLQLIWLVKQEKYVYRNTSSYLFQLHLHTTILNTYILDPI